MSGQSWAQILVYAAVLVALAFPLGLWMARVYGEFRAWRPLAWLERGFYRVIGTDSKRQQDCKGYAVSTVIMAIASGLLLYAIQRLQAHLPLNPDHQKAVPSD